MEKETINEEVIKTEETKAVKRKEPNVCLSCEG